MAEATNLEFRNKVIYCIFTRQYSEKGTFVSVQKDLDRIRALGTDIIWFLPIHPIGKKERKGKLGSPYAVMDYLKINPEFGSLDDFKNLVEDIHSKGMKCIIDVVFNHTSPDSWLFLNYPEYFYKDANGNIGNKIGEWLDIIDLNYNNKGLWVYLIDILKYWAKIVDGFRCDVAPLIPLEFWKKARKEVEQIRPDCIWLSESVEPIFTRMNRARGFISLSDAEMYQAFDLTYDYDIYGDMLACLKDETKLDIYLEKINTQESIYPHNYSKLRFLENHDRQRAAFLIPDERIRRNWTAFLYFLKGTVLIYNGQENQCLRRPNLFNREPIKWDEQKDISEYLARLYRIKQSPLFTNSSFKASHAGNGMIVSRHVSVDGQAIGIFGTRHQKSLVDLNIPDGTYVNQIDGHEIFVDQGLLSFYGEPIIMLLSH